MFQLFATMWTYVDDHKTYLTRMTAVCKTCGLCAFIRRELLSSQTPLAVSRMWAYLERTELVYNDLEVCQYVELYVENYARVTGPLVNYMSNNNAIRCIQRCSHLIGVLRLRLSLFDPN